ncbi:uncharacterized protein B0T15DRAFT_538603 [Chaetomium strumarium]|uniref:Uncharacterized protein n=1 Tax=Chaetomium strumarium TaxID=1170767 RepID=A0AAJ0GMZ0_9PEZI|nr:hypothetical protein B0T15DRAFT_538603 [Chaetomium strumarium]
MHRFRCLAPLYHLITGLADLQTGSSIALTALMGRTMHECGRAVSRCGGPGRLLDASNSNRVMVSKRPTLSLSTRYLSTILEVMSQNITISC